MNFDFFDLDNFLYAHDNIIGYFSILDSLYFHNNYSYYSFVSPVVPQLEYTWVELRLNWFADFFRFIGLNPNNMHSNIFNIPLYSKFHFNNEYIHWYNYYELTSSRSNLFIIDNNLSWYSKFHSNLMLKRTLLDFWVKNHYIKHNDFTYFDSFYLFDVRLHSIMKLSSLFKTYNLIGWDILYKNCMFETKFYSLPTYDFGIIAANYHIYYANDVFYIDYYLMMYIKYIFIYITNIFFFFSKLSLYNLLNNFLAEAPLFPYSLFFFLGYLYVYFLFFIVYYYIYIILNILHIWQFFLLKFFPFIKEKILIFIIILFKIIKIIFTYFNLLIFSGFFFSILYKDLKVLFFFIIRLLYFILMIIWQTVWFSHFTYLRWDYYLHFYPRYVSIWHYYYFNSKYPKNWRAPKKNLTHYYLCRYFFIYFFKYYIKYLKYYYLVFKKNFIWFLLNVYGDFTYLIIYYFYAFFAFLLNNTNLITYNIVWFLTRVIRREIFYFTQTDVWHRVSSLIHRPFYFKEFNYDNIEIKWGENLPWFGKPFIWIFSIFTPSTKNALFYDIHMASIKIHFLNILNIFFLIISFLNFFLLKISYMILFFFLQKRIKSYKVIIFIFNIITYLKIKLLKFILFFEFFSIKKLIGYFISFLFIIFSIIILIFNKLVNKKYWFNIYLFLHKCIFTIVEYILLTFFGIFYILAYLVCSIYSFFFFIIIKVLLFFVKKRFIVFCLFIIIAFGLPEFWFFICIITKWFGTVLYFFIVSMYELYIDPNLTYDTAMHYLSHRVYYFEMMSLTNTRYEIYDLEMFLSSPLQKVARFVFEPDYYFKIKWEHWYYYRIYRFDGQYYRHLLAYLSFPYHQRLVYYGFLKILYKYYYIFWDWYIGVYLKMYLHPSLYYYVGKFLLSLLYSYRSLMSDLNDYFYIIIFSFLNFFDYYTYIYDIFYYLDNCLLWSYFKFYWNIFFIESFFDICFYNFLDIYAKMAFIALSDDFFSFFSNISSNIWDYSQIFVKKYLTYAYIDLYSYQFEEFEPLIYCEEEKEGFAWEYYYKETGLYFYIYLYLLKYINIFINIFIYLYDHLVFYKYFKNADSLKLLNDLSTFNFATNIFFYWKKVRIFFDYYLYYYEFKPYETLYNVYAVENTIYDCNYWYEYYSELTVSRLYEFPWFGPNGWDHLLYWFLETSDNIKYLVKIKKPLNWFWSWESLYHLRNDVNKYTTIHRYWLFTLYPKDLIYKGYDLDNFSTYHQTYIYGYIIHIFVLWFVVMLFITIFMPCCTLFMGRAFMESNHSPEYYWRIFKFKAPIEENKWIFNFRVKTEREIFLGSQQGTRLTFDYMLYLLVKNRTLNLNDICPNFKKVKKIYLERNTTLFDFSVLRGYYFVYPGYEWFHQTMVKEFDSFNLFIAYAYNKNDYIKLLMQEYDPELHEMLEYDQEGGHLGVLYEREFWNKIFNYFMFLDSKIFNYQMPHYSYHKDQSVVFTTVSTLDSLQKNVSSKEVHRRRVIFEVENDEENVYMFYGCWLLFVPSFALGLWGFEMFGYITTTAFEELKMLMFHILLTDFSIFDYYIFQTFRGYYHISFYSLSSKEFTGDNAEIPGLKEVFLDTTYVYVPYLKDEVEAYYTEPYGRFLSYFWIDGNLQALLNEFYYFTFGNFYNEYDLIDQSIYYIVIIIIILCFFYYFIKVTLYFCFRKDAFLLKVESFRPYLFQLDSFRSLLTYFKIYTYNKKKILKRGINDKT